MDTINLEKKNPKEINVYPLKKTRRILLFLADFFICFFLSFTLFQVAINPLAQTIMDSTGLSSEMTTAQKSRDSVLYGNELLFAEDSEEPSAFASNLQYTADCYVGYLVGAEGYEKCDVFHNYYVAIKVDEAGYAAIFEEYDAAGAYFGASHNLSETYVEEWAPYFDPKDTISSKGSEDMESFIESFFLSAYAQMLSDISENDLTYGGVSYKENQARFSEISDLQDISIMGAALCSHLISCLLLFMLIPCLSKNRKSVAMMALRNERVNASKLTLLRKRDVLLRFVYDFASMAMGLFLLPLTTVDFNELFSLPVLFPLSLVAIVYVIGSLVFLLIDAYGRTLSDRLTGTVLVDEETLDEIYRAKGYPI